MSAPLLPERRRHGGRAGSALARALGAAIAAAASAGVPSAAAQAVAPPVAQAAATAEPRFEIRSFNVEGNSVLPTDRVDALLARFAGGDRSFADVDAARGALEQAYRDAGFGAVRVRLPEQRVGDGVVALQVVEPRIGSVVITGATRSGTANIRRSLPALAEGEVPNTAALAAQLRLVNENPGKQTTVELQQGATALLLDARIAVTDGKPWKVGAVVNDTGTAATGRLRTGVFVQHANVADLDHVVTAQLTTSPGRIGEVTIAAANYRVPLVRLGDALDVYAAYADVDSGVVGDLFTVRGKGYVGGLRYHHNLPPLGPWRQRLAYAFEWRVFDNQVGTVATAADLLADVTVHPLSVGYTAGWLGDGRQVEFGLTAVRNVPGGSHGGSADFAAVRSGARSTYTLLRGSAQLLQTLPAAFRLRLAAEGQYTRDALIPGEQFGIGGHDSVRGFLEREISDDVGARASVELQTADVSGPGQRMAASALVFADIGWVRRNHALPGENHETRIASVGAGVRVALAPHISFRADLAHILRGATARQRGREALHFSLGVAY
ncbi:MAG: ShlB/FhaC/HecB family hemolysin secretion/activation protein [Caldimonas sp.]